MSYAQVNSSAPNEGELNGELFGSGHGPQGDWKSLKGSMLTPMELSYSEQTENYNDGRVDSQKVVVAPGLDWLPHGPIESGPYNPDSMTHGTDKHMPPSS